jgi:hypothetical protein
VQTLLVLDLLNHLQERKPLADVIEPFICRGDTLLHRPISVANVGWYPLQMAYDPKVPKPQNLLV